MIATVLDTQTGIIYKKYGPRSWEWAENNWSCDCNRKPDDIIMIDISKNINICEGSQRFIVIAAEMNDDDEDYEYTLAELNSRYNIALLKAHGIVPI